MNPIPSFLLHLITISVCLSLLIHGSICQNLIQETCITCSKDDANINYNFCISALQAAPPSQCTTLRGLGMVSIQIILHNVTDTRCHIKNLMEDRNLEPYVRMCLSDCFELYSDSIPSIKQAIRNYDLKRYVDTNIQISSIMDAATTCEDGFAEKEGAVSRLKERNGYTFQLSAIALSIMKLLQNAPAT
ncbi:putative invertase inhibitor [Lycium barbarum]|uniref:putative invertase inhibitor n=1 Tax=Lycium barbarum TaxID=112863 RepID=UPI00293E5468|nr:putative invertase inhibitor [Lycium barbarum]